MVCEVTGIGNAASRSGASIVSFEEEIPTKHPSGRICKEFPLAKPVVSSSALVNVAKMKTHGLMTFTGAVKNLYGCVSGARKAHLHFRYQEPSDFGLMISDLLELVNPRISILDAVVGMDGEGPSHGRPRNIGLLMASPDPVALDVVAMHVAMADPMTVGPTTSGRADAGLPYACENGIVTPHVSLGRPLAQRIVPDSLGGCGFVSALWPMCSVLSSESHVAYELRRDNPEEGMHKVLLLPRALPLWGYHAEEEAPCPTG